VARRSVLKSVSSLAACCALACAFLSSAVAVAQVATPVSRSAPAFAGGKLTAPDAASASALAASSGEPVEIMADRTDWSQTFAEPQGGFEAVESLVPQQVQEPDGSWVPVDTTLSVESGGLVVPAAITTGLTLSNGGSGPLYTLSQGAQSLSVSWPFGSLPVPSLSGATATYADVLPGVNLLVSATPTGVSELIQVMSAVAAANPDLAKVTFPVAGAGVSVSADGQGGLVADDSSGQPVFSAPPPQMWDSAGSEPTASGQAPVAMAGTNLGAGGPVLGDHQAVMPVSAGAASVSLVPSASVLSGPSVVYPVYIDPVWYGDDANGTASWADATTFGDGGSGGDWEYSASDGGIRVGVACDTADDPNCPNESHSGNPEYIKVRSFLNFPIPAALNGNLLGNGPYYLDAKLHIFDQWSWNCNDPTEVDLWQTGYAGQDTSWDNQPAQMTELDTPTFAYGDNCAGNWHDFDVTSAVAATQQSGYSVTDVSGKPDVTFELKADDSDESNWNLYSWKRFTAAGSTNPMELEIYWIHAPVSSDPETQGTFSPQNGTPQTGLDCATSASAPDFVTSAPTVQANVSYASVDQAAFTQLQETPPAEIYGSFTWVETGVSDPLFGSASTGPDLPSTLTAQAGGSGGQEYGWSEQAVIEYYDPVAQSSGTVTEPSSTATCYYVVETEDPTGTVDISGTVGAVGQPIAFQFSPVNYSDPQCPGTITECDEPAGYIYGFGNPSLSRYIAADKNGDASITITPYTGDPTELYVTPVDFAGNPSSSTVTELSVTAGSNPSNIDSLGYWKLNGSGSPTDNGLSLSNGNSLTNPVYQCPGPYGDSPIFDVTTGNQVSCTLTGEADSQPVVANEWSFSVAAWADPGSCTSTCVVMSEDGTSVSEFALEWIPDSSANTQGTWEFRMHFADDPSSTLFFAQSGEMAPGWTQVTGVFNQGQDLVLYVYANGVEQTFTSQSGLAAWNTDPVGPFRIGAGFGGASSFPGGSISDACVFYGALQPADVTNLVDAQPAGSDVPYGDGCANLYAQYQYPN
jgi:hypothetical protein